MGQAMRDDSGVIDLGQLGEPSEAEQEMSMLRLFITVLVSRLDEHVVVTDKDLEAAMELEVQMFPNPQEDKEFIINVRKPEEKEVERGN